MKLSTKIIIILFSLLFYPNLFAQEQFFTIDFWRVEELYGFHGANTEALPEGFQEFTYFDSFTTGLKTVVVSDSISFDSSDINELILSQDFFGEDCLKIFFKKTGAEKLASFTEANIGNNILIEFNGIVISNVKVLQKISGGSLALSNPESKNTLYQIIQLFECKNETNIHIPENQIFIKTRTAISNFDDVDEKNLTQLATNFFYSIFEESDDSYKEYVLPESQEQIAELVKIFRSKYQDCIIHIARTESLSSRVIRKYKETNSSIPLYFSVDNGDYGFCEDIIFVIDNFGKLKIKQLTLK